MLVVTTENIPHHRVIEIKGQCFGVVVRSRGLGGNIIAGLRSIVGGGDSRIPSCSRKLAGMRSTVWYRTPPRWAPTRS